MRHPKHISNVQRQLTCKRALDFDLVLSERWEKFNLILNTSNDKFIYDDRRRRHSSLQDFFFPLYSADVWRQNFGFCLLIRIDRLSLRWCIKKYSLMKIERKSTTKISTDLSFVSFFLFPIVSSHSPTAHDRSNADVLLTFDSLLFCCDDAMKWNT